MMVQIWGGSLATEPLPFGTPSSQVTCTGTNLLSSSSDQTGKVPTGTDLLSNIWSYVTLSAARQSNTFSHQGESMQMLE